MNGKLLTITFLILTLQSCASFREYVHKDEKEWATRQPDPTLQLAHRMFLIGDAGYAQPGETLPALALLKEKLANAGENSTVVFLGDNLYPHGMAPKMLPEDRARDEYRLKAQLEAVSDFSGRIFFIAGNHDWYQYGIDGLNRQRKFIEKYLDRKDVWAPDCGCGTPEEVDLGENLVLILVDSQWYLGDWEGEREINDGCEIKSRAAFRLAFEEAVKGNRNKNVIIAVHHPPFTQGPHGGKYTFKEHLFPLTAVSDGLYLPLPGLGSAFAFLRSTIGHRQDVVHPQYRELRDAMVSSARKNGSFIFASGHDHSLQYIEKDDQAFIVSGSGSKRSATGKGEGLQYAYGQHGLVQLDFYQDGTTWAHYWVAEDNGREAFRTQVKGPLPILQEEGTYDFTLYESEKDTVMRQLDDRQDYSRSALGTLIWGEHFRKTYNTKIAMPLLDLATFQGGVEPVKQGGGYQTNSLRLQNQQDRQYNMRSIKKDATRVLPYPLNQSFALGMVQDAFTSAHPLAALALPPLAKAAGIYYSSPQLFFTPRQPLLGKFNASYGDDAYQVEERADDNVWEDYEPFGESDNIISTLDVLEEIIDDHDHLIDQPFVARSRIFDILVGDWDRHDDQWRWAAIEKGDQTYYRPIPRDRDQAFSKYDGFLMALVRNASPAARPLRPYTPYPKKIQWSNYGSRYFDGTFLTGLEWPVWEKHARELQNLVTDDVIEEAFRNAWPAEIYALDAPGIIRTLQERRKNLVDLARDFYEIRARKVDVLGTNKKDLFDVERLPDGRTRVKVYDTNSKGEKEELFYERLFLPGETNEINLYGMDDEDIFVFSGEAAKGIKVRAVGGLGEDRFFDNSQVRGPGKKTIIHDFADESNEVTAGPETHLRLSRNPVLNTYNRKAPHNDYNWGFLFPSLSFNPDDGFLLGFFGQQTYFGFMKAPYASLHNFNGSFAFATLGYALSYEGEFVDAFGKWEFSLEAELQSERYSTNFYGFGNETISREDSLGLDFHRVRQGLVSVFPGLMRRLNQNSTFTIGPTFESFQIDSTEGRFLAQNAEALGISPEVFAAQDFAGVRAVLDFRNQNHPTFPTRGLAFLLDIGWKQQLQDAGKNFAYLNTALTLYQKLDPAGNLVLAGRVGLWHNFNKDGYEFYQGATLGGIGPRSNFRGFRRERFNGATAFFHNTDLRWKMVRSRNKVLPFTFGLLAGFDHGRVWQKDEDSEIWHYSFGGGVFITPLDLMSLHFSIFRGDNEEDRFTFGGTFFF